MKSLIPILIFPAILLGAVSFFGCQKETEDEICNPASWYKDADGDGFGNPAIALSSCLQPAGFVLLNNDCDDMNRAVNPGAVEISGDGIDNNCDGESLISIGDFYQGGIVFYIDNSGEHGLISSTIDQGSQIPWCDTGQTDCYVLSTREELGYGKQNTKYIISQFGEGSYAAKFCDQSIVNSYTDWYLPSIEELILIHTNLHLNGLGDFLDAYYWSSTQTGSSSYSESKLFGNNAYSAVGRYKKEGLFVRAIREF